MDRRGFLKGIFGAAVVAAMPKIVVEQIENQSPPIPPNIKPIDEHWMEASDNLLFIYDKENLIGFSTEFNVTMKQENYGPYQPYKRVKKYAWEQDFQAPPEYLTGPKSWRVIASNIHWSVDPTRLLEKNKPLNCLAKTPDNLKLTGEIWLSRLDLSMEMVEDYTTCNAEFEGSGALILNSDDNPTATK